MPAGASQHDRSRHPTDDDVKDAIHMRYHINPALEAELAYRRELAMAAGKVARTRRPRRRWLQRSA
jgi:hypothetical protein